MGELFFGQEVNPDNLGEAELSHANRILADMIDACRRVGPDALADIGEMTRYEAIVLLSGAVSALALGADDLQFGDAEAWTEGMAGRRET